MNLKISELEVRCIRVALDEYREKARKWIEHLREGIRPESKESRERGIKNAEADIEAVNGILEELSKLD